jgi:5-formyltetrahydrofolate cyclo-ligase
MNKAELRNFYLSKRKNIDEDFLKLSSEQIKQQFLTFFKDWKVNVVHTFLPIEHHKEINTLEIVKALKLHNKDLQVVVSKSDMKTFEMTSYILQEDTNLLVNRWGIPEPTNAESIDNLKIDMVLVPLLAFDKSGHRVGYGKGFYDRFLKRCREDIIKVGLCLEPPVAVIPDTNEFDITLSYCVTPKKVYSF